MEVLPNLRPPRITFHVDRFEAFLNCRRLRNALQLPLQDSRPGFNNYEPFPFEEEVFQGIIELGYRGALTKVRDFRTKNLPPMWHDLFMILNRCLTPKAFGSDSASINLLKLFHAVAYDLHADFTELIWTDLTERIYEKLKESKSKKYLPFPRFLGLFIDRMMHANPEIPPRVDYPRNRHFSMTRFRAPKAVFAYIRDLPVQMVVRYARIEDTDVRAYCESRGIELPAAAAAQAPQDSPPTAEAAHQEPVNEAAEQSPQPEAHETVLAEIAGPSTTQAADINIPLFNIPGNVHSEFQQTSPFGDEGDDFNLDVDALTGAKKANWGFLSIPLQQRTPSHQTNRLATYRIISTLTFRPTSVLR